MSNVTPDSRKSEVRRTALIVKTCERFAPDKVEIALAGIVPHKLTR